jgi:hypothetical protein
MVNQIIADTRAPADQAISLAGKWAPRESDRKFGWQAGVMAARLSTGRGSLRTWRRTIASLNKRLGTVQVLQCGKDWHSIEFPGSITSITRARQHKAFMDTNTVPGARNLVPSRSSRPSSRTCISSWSEDQSTLVRLLSTQLSLCMVALSTSTI